MEMVAGATDDLGSIPDYLNEEEANGLFTPGSGCDWSSLPTMIGSKIYPLEATIAASNLPRGAMIVPIPNNPIFVCVRQDGSVGASGDMDVDCSSPERNLDGDGE